MNGTSNESSIWQSFDELDAVINATVYSYKLNNTDPYSQYEFRVIPNWFDFGKSIPGIPSNASLPVTPVFLYRGISFNQFFIQILE